eukprot:7382204-Pyramimonas_sp.AAC.1
MQSNGHVRPKVTEIEEGEEISHAQPRCNASVTLWSEGARWTALSHHPGQKEIRVGHRQGQARTVHYVIAQPGWQRPSTGDTSSPTSGM